MSRSVFYGVGAYVGSITGATTIGFWPDDPVKLKWDPTLLVKVDLARNPEAVRQGTIKPDAAGNYDLDVDDFAGYGTGGLTRIGPMYPGGAIMGTCYLEQSKCAALKQYDPRKPAAGNAYEWVTVVDHDGPTAGRRFHGFHGKVQKVSTTNPNIALVSLWPRGTGHLPGQAAMGTYWLDFATFVLSGDTDLVSITPIAGSTGGIYIDHKAGGAGAIAFDPPKTPRYIGGVSATRGAYVR